MSSIAQTTVIPMAGAQSVWGFLRKHHTLMNVLTLGAVLAIALAYVVQINAAAAKGYQIRELETHIRELSLTNQTLELDLQQAQSLENVTRAVKMLGMVPSETPRYVQGTVPTYVLAE